MRPGDIIGRVPPEDYIRFEEIMLERMRVDVKERLSGYMAQTMTVEEWQDRASCHMVRKLAAEVLADRVEADTYEIREHERYATWKDWIIDTLPFNGFRRRFLSLIWFDDPLYEPKVTLVSHKITVADFATYPQTEIRDLGPIMGPPVIVRQLRQETGT